MCRQGIVVLKCLNVFVHIAEVGPRILIGFPFLFQYRLAFVPTKQFLIPMEVMKFLRAPGHIRAPDHRMHVLSSAF